MCLGPALGRAYFEGEGAADHGVEDDSAAPQVDLQSIVSFSCDHFGSGVAGTSTGSLEFFLLCWLGSRRSAFTLILVLDVEGRPFLLGWHLLVGVGKSKIHNFDVLFRIEQHVLRLEIAVHNAQPVQIVDSIDDLMEEAASLALSQSRWVGGYFFCSAM